MSKGAKIDEELSRALISLSSFITAQITLLVISMLQPLNTHTLNNHEQERDVHVLGENKTVTLHTIIMTTDNYLLASFSACICIMHLFAIVLLASHFTAFPPRS